MCLSALLSKKIRVASTFLAIVNNADMNMVYKYLTETVLSIILHIYSEMELLILW